MSTKKLDQGEEFLLRTIKNQPGIKTGELLPVYKAQAFGPTGGQCVHFCKKRNGLVAAGLIHMEKNGCVHNLTTEGEMEAAKLISPEAANAEQLEQLATA